MAADPLEVRLARLEGGYEQIDRRLGTIEDRLSRLEHKVDSAVDRLDAKIDAAFNRLDTKVDGVASSLRQDIRTVTARVHTLLYGIIAAISVPILLRVLFP